MLTSYIPIYHLLLSLYYTLMNWPATSRLFSEGGPLSIPKNFTRKTLVTMFL